MPKITNDNGETVEISQEEYDQYFTKYNKDWKPSENDYFWYIDEYFSPKIDSVNDNICFDYSKDVQLYQTQHIAKMHAVKAKATSDLKIEVFDVVPNKSFQLCSEQFDEDWLNKEHLGITYRECFEWFSEQ